MSAATKALPVVGGVLDEQNGSVLAKQLCEDSRCGKSGYLLGHDVQPACYDLSHSTVYSRIKGWSQSWINLVRVKSCDLRLHRKQKDIAYLADARLTPSRCIASVLVAISKVSWHMKKLTAPIGVVCYG